MKMNVALFAVLVFLACCLTDTLAGTYLICTADDTSVKTPFIDDDSGNFTDCAQLIGVPVDIYQTEYRNECQRWMGGPLPDSVSSAYVTECSQDSSGKLRYRSEVCCHGALSVTRCFSCSNQTSHYACDYQGTVETCATGEICSTTFDYYGSKGQYCPRKINKGCMKKSTCDAKVTTNSQTCTSYVDQPRCAFCYDDTFGNWEGSNSRSYKYCGQRPPRTARTPTACDKSNCVYGSCILNTTKPLGYYCRCYSYSWKDSTGRCPYTHCSNGTKCLNGGRCSNSNSIPYYSCCCKEGYFGQNCNQSVPACTNQPDYCQNGGTCQNYGATGLRCLCPAGWVGETCERKTDIQCMNTAGRIIGGVYRTLYKQGSWYTCSNISGYSFSTYYSSCRYRMRIQGRPLFENRVHGFVDKFEYSGLKTCAAGDKCMWYSPQYCCPTCMSAPCLNGGWCVQKENHDFVCKCRFGFEGKVCENKVTLCITSGDPHYQTFDGVMIHFQGTCKYNMATPSITSTGLPHFQVLTKNENRDGRTEISYPKYLEVVVYGKRIRLETGKKAYVDDVEIYPDVFYPGVEVTLNGQFLRVETNFSLVVEFDGSWLGLIKLPASYGGKIGGICGNYDGDGSNDMITSDGRNVSDLTNKYSEIGNSYYVGDETDPNCPKLDIPDPIWTTEDQDEAESDDHCGPIKDVAGPFRSCVVAEQDAAKMHFENCVYDVAINVSKERSCASIEAFVTLCKQKGLSASPTWRAAINCPMTCPAGRLYKALASACHSTCERPLADKECALPDAESCKCPNEKVLHNGACKDRNVCGCLDSNNVRYQIGDTWKSMDCGKEYTCTILTPGSWGEITEKSASCQSGYECKVSSGVASCVSKLINGGWGAWQQWTTCTSPCAEGEQTRSRDCDNPAPSSGGASCSGLALETRSCRDDCPSFKPQECQGCDFTRNPAGYLPDPCSCSNYYQCYSYHGQWRAYRRVCPLCSRWSQSDLTCVDDPSITDRSACAQTERPENVVSAGGTCRRSGHTYKVIPGDTKEYLWSVFGVEYVMPCPPGTGFDTGECQCVFGNVAARVSRRVFLLSFDQSYETVGGLWVQPINMARLPGGVKGNCANFNGQDSRIEIPYFTNNAFSEFTFSLWYKLPNGQSFDEQGLVYNGDCNDDGSIQIILQGPNIVKAGILANTDLRNGQLFFDKAVPDRWHHVAFAYNGTMAKLFVNGKLIKVLPVTGPTRSNHCPLVLGCMFGAGAGGCFKGQMDEVSFYKKGLSTKEIEDLYAGKEVL